MKRTKRIGLALAIALVLLAWNGVARGGDIHDAAKAGNVEKVKKFLAGNPDLVNAEDDNNQTPLHLAANKDVIEVLLSHNADVNAKDNGDNTPLHLASNKGVAELLLSHNADVNAKDKEGQTPLHMAASFNRNKDVTEVLLANKADVNARDNTGDTPLHKAAYKGKKDVAEMLLFHGADINTKNNTGDTPLHRAVLLGKKDLAEMLLFHKADVNARDNDGDTPLHKAAYYGKKDMAEMFLFHKADVNARDNYGRTPLHMAAINDYKDVAELLLANKADVNARDNEGSTPLHHAAYYDNKNVAEALLSHNADVNVKDNNGFTPLRRAERNAFITATSKNQLLSAENNSSQNSGEDWKTYRDTSFEFKYSSILSLSFQEENVILNHSVDCRHPDPGDFKGDSEGKVRILDKLTDFDVLLRMFNAGFKDTVRVTGTDYLIKEYFPGNKIKLSPGFIDEFSAGSLKGYRITSVVEGCGQFTYYFPISANKTLFVRRSLISELIRYGGGDYRKYLSLPGIIPPDEEDKLFNQILSTFRSLN